MMDLGRLSHRPLSHAMSLTNASCARSPWFRGVKRRSEWIRSYSARAPCEPVRHVSHPNIKTRKIPQLHDAITPQPWIRF
jgi:hypothetical protein